MRKNIKNFEKSLELENMFDTMPIDNHKENHSKKSFIMTRGIAKLRAKNIVSEEFEIDVRKNRDLDF